MKTREPLEYLRWCMERGLDDDLRQIQTDLLTTGGDPDAVDVQLDVFRSEAQRRIDDAVGRLRRFLDDPKNDQPMVSLFAESIVGYIAERPRLWNEVLRRVGARRDAAFIAQCVFDVLRDNAQAGR